MYADFPPALGRRIFNVNINAYAVSIRTGRQKIGLADPTFAISIPDPITHTIIDPPSSPGGIYFATIDPTTQQTYTFVDLNGNQSSYDTIVSSGAPSFTINYHSASTNTDTLLNGNVGGQYTFTRINGTTLTYTIYFFGFG